MHKATRNLIFLFTNGLRFDTQKYLEGNLEKDIADIMGHTPAKTTSKNYLHTQMDRLRNVVNSASYQKQEIEEKINVLQNIEFNK